MGLTKNIAIVILIILALFVHFFPVLDEFSINGTPDMETNGAILVIALDTYSHISLFTNCAEEVPS